MTPKYPHNCPHCVYLTTTNWVLQSLELGDPVDLYWCERHAPYRTSRFVAIDDNYYGPTVIDVNNMTWLARVFGGSWGRSHLICIGVRIALRKGILCKCVVDTILEGVEIRGTSVSS